MNDVKEHATVDDLQQEQMLKIITKGFYKELVKYGVHKRNIITIATNLLDCLLTDKALSKGADEYYDGLFTIKDIQDEWKSHGRLNIDAVSIVPLVEAQYPRIVEWLKDPEIRNSFVVAFPDSAPALKKYMEDANRKYFSILYQDEPVGMIGAENIDQGSKKTEMKKFVGNAALQGRGIGKYATFLFLYYAFMIMELNKIYIHSGDTNIRNINLNSKFGFELEGIFFSDTYINNEKHDVVRMGLQKERWIEIFSIPASLYL